MEISKPTQTIFFETILHGLDKRLDKEKAEASVRTEVEGYMQRFRRWGEEPGFLYRDLETAKRVQKASFPLPPPTISGLKFAVFYKPAHSVGGDYYDFLRLEDAVWGFAIGDISGKGMGAALLMATLQASMRTHALRPRSTIETLMTNINRLLRESSPAEFFASLFYAEYQPAARVLTYINAGHNPPIVMRRNSDRCNLLMLDSGGAPVGALESSCYRSVTLQLEPGDLLVGYTDGITESEDPDGEPFGQHRLEELLRRCSIQDPQALLRTILDELFAHTRCDSQADDMTLVVMRVES